MYFQLLPAGGAACPGSGPRYLQTRRRRVIGWALPDIKGAGGATDAREQRFTELYERHYDDIYRYVIRRVVSVDVGDVVAEVFLVAWRRIAEVPPDATLPWLYRVAGYVLANEIRGQRRGWRLVTRMASEPDSSRIDDHAESVAGRLDIAAAFDRLPPADQEVLRLVSWERLDTADAARALGCSRATFAMRLLRARRRLREQIRIGAQLDGSAGAAAKSTPAMRGV